MASKLASDVEERRDGHRQADRDHELGERGRASRRCRKIRRSSTRPEQRGEHHDGRAITAGTVAQPHSTLALKYIAADTYACAPKARLNTPDVL